MDDPTDLAQQETDAHTDQERAKAARRQQIEDIRWLMTHAQGRRIVTRIFERTGYRRTPFNTNGSTMAFNAGTANVGLWLEAEVLDASPEHYLRLLREYTRNDN